MKNLSALNNNIRLWEIQSCRNFPMAIIIVRVSMPVAQVLAHIVYLAIVDLALHDRTGEAFSAAIGHDAQSLTIEPINFQLSQGSDLIALKISFATIKSETTCIPSFGHFQREDVLRCYF